MKKVVVALEHRFYIYDGELYTKLAFPYAYWESYLDFFTEVVIVARAKEITELDEQCVKVTGDRVSYEPIVYYIGLKKFLLNLPLISSQLKSVAKSNDKFILRSGNITNVLWLWLKFYQKSYIREYPGNIYEGITGYGGNSFFINMLARLLNSFAKTQAKYALANSFVSLDCKNIYESEKPGYVFSSFNLDEINIRKINFATSDISRIVTVGRLEGEKGHKDLIEALALVSLKTRLTVIGDGTQRTALEVRAKELGLDVDFKGVITNRELLFKAIVESDLYVIPSHTEGMPRSLLEAMAIGMPCMGCSVGGIPEVLSSDYLVQAKEPKALSDLISRVCSDKRLRAKMSDDNLLVIKEKYSKESMDKKKLEFWNELYK